MSRFNLPDDVPIEAKMVTKAIRSAQTQVEQQNFEIRKNVLKYDEVMNKQRTVIYDERRRVLEGEDLHEQVQHMIDDVVTAYVDGATAEGYAEDWDLDELWTALATLYPVASTIEELERTAGGAPASPREACVEELLADAHARLRRARGGRSAPRSCASSSAAWCCRSWTASGASTSTRWTTCARASACAPWPSATRWSSTSGRASTCSTR